MNYNLPGWETTNSIHSGHRLATSGTISLKMSVFRTAAPSLSSSSPRAPAAMIHTAALSNGSKSGKYNNLCN